MKAVGVAPVTDAQDNNIGVFADGFLDYGGPRLSCLENIGLQTPIHVWKADDDEIHLVAGRHRIEAAKSLSLEEIDAQFVEMDEADRELWEIDENLIRAELTQLEIAEHLVRRKELYDLKGGEIISTHGGQQSVGFDKATAELIGCDKSTLNKARKRATEIATQVRDAIRDTPAADKGTELDALIGLSEPDQKQAVKLYNDGSVTSIRKARAQIEGASEQNSDGADQKDFERIMRAWEKSGEGGRKRFLESSQIGG